MEQTKFNYKSKTLKVRYYPCHHDQFYAAENDMTHSWNFFDIQKKFFGELIATSKLKMSFLALVCFLEIHFDTRNQSLGSYLFDKMLCFCYVGRFLKFC